MNPNIWNECGKYKEHAWQMVFVYSWMNQVGFRYQSMNQLSNSVSFDTQNYFQMYEYVS